MNRLNINRAFNNNLKYFIDVFVSYYGEEKREEITKKFNKIVFLGYQEPTELRLYIKNIKDNQKKEIIDVILASTNLDEESKKKLKEFLKQNFLMFDTPLRSILGMFYSYLDGNKNLGDYENFFIDSLRILYSDANLTNLDELIASSKFDILKDIRLLYEQEMVKYQDLIKRLEPYQLYVEKNEEYKRKLETKYRSKYLKGLMNKLPKNVVDKFVMTNNNKQSFMENYLNYKLNYKTLIESFNKNSDDIIKNDPSSFRSKVILKDRIKYFNNLGINLGNNYDNYLNDDMSLSFLPTQEDIQKIISYKEEIIREMMNEYYSVTDDYLNNHNRLLAEGVVNIDDICKYMDYQSQLSYVKPCITQKNNLQEIKYALCMYCQSSNIVDHLLVHELNHIYEMNVELFDNDKYLLSAGWDNITSLNDTNEDIEKKENNDIEMFNEIINELLAQEISKMMEENNIMIFDNKKTSRNLRKTYYEKIRFLVNEFFQIYKEEIIASRQHGKISIIYDAVGKDNFNELNDLINDYCVNFKGNKLQMLNISLKENKDDILVREHYSYIKRRNIILEKMSEVYKQKKNR